MFSWNVTPFSSANNILKNGAERSSETLPPIKLLCSIVRRTITLKVKVKFTLEQATKAQRGSRCIALLFLQTRRKMGVGGQRHASAALPPGKTRYPLCTRLGGQFSKINLKCDYICPRVIQCT